MHEKRRTQAHFNAHHGYWRRVYEQPDTIMGYSLRKQHDAAIQHIADVIPARGTVLDVGCGAGITVQALNDLGYRVFGVDFAERMLPPSGQFAVADAECLPFPSHVFDGVVALGLLGNISNYRFALNEMYRVLAPNGVLVLTVPNPWALDRWVRLPRSLPLVLGHRFRRGWSMTKNIARRVLGRPMRPTVRYGHSMSPRRFQTVLRTCGFGEVSCTALTFIPLQPFGLPIGSDERLIQASEWFSASHRLQWFGTNMLYHARK